MRSMQQLSCGSQRGHVVKFCLSGQTISAVEAATQPKEIREMSQLMAHDR